MSEKNYDVVIIGAGSVGVPTAMFLAEAGFNVLALDEMPSHGQGCNKAAIGGIRATHSDVSKIHICQKSLDIFSTWQARYGDDISWYKGGYSFVAYTPEEEQTFKELLKIQHKHGLNIQWLNREDMLELVPSLNPEGLIGGTFSPDDGSASPLQSSCAFHRRAKELGAKFHYNEKVVDIIVENDRVKGVQTNKDTYSTAIVINAAGGMAREVAQMAGLDVQVQPESHEAGITEPLAHFMEPMIVDIRRAPGSANYYFYQHDTGAIIFCITPEPPILGTDTRETSVFLPQVAKRMVDLMPILANARVRRVWRGLYPMTPDGFPIVGKDREVEGYIHAVGMCGQGFMLGPGLATYLVKLIEDDLDEERREVLEGLSPYRKFGGEEKLQ